MANDTAWEPRAEVLAARDVGRAVAVLGMVVGAAFLALEVLAMRRADARTAMRRADARTATTGAARARSVRAPCGCVRTQIELLAVTLTSLWVICNGAALWWPDWNQLGGTPVCNVYVNGVVTIAYVVMKQATYALLSERVRVVHKALAMESIHFKLLRATVYVSVFAGVPLIFWPLIFIYFRGIVVPEGVCLQYTTELFPVYLFLICDSLLSATLIFLFVAPIWNHVKKMESPRAAETQMTVARSGPKEHAGTNSLQAIMRMAWWNLALSSAMIAFTVFSLGYFVYGLWDVREKLQSGATLGATHIFVTILPEVDAIVNMVLVHAIITHWIPPAMRVKLRSLMARLHASSATGNTAVGVGVDHGHGHNPATTSGRVGADGGTFASPTSKAGVLTRQASGDAFASNNPTSAASQHNLA